MSTNAIIGYERHNGEVIAIYLHNDGYPEHAGKILARHFSRHKKIKRLINLGDISVLARKIRPPEGKFHSFDQPIPHICVAYHRDRGEDLKIHHYKDQKEFFDSYNGYKYLFGYDSYKWFIAGYDDEYWKPLDNQRETKALKKTRHKRRTEKKRRNMNRMRQKAEVFKTIKNGTIQQKEDFLGCQVSDEILDDLHAHMETAWNNMLRKEQMHFIRMYDPQYKRH